MSELTNILTSRLDLKRLTPYLLDPVTPAASHAPDRQPARACQLAVHISGATISSGLVNVAGSTNETISFSANGFQISAKEFSSIAGITISGIAGGAIDIKAVSKTGQPVNQEKAIYTTLPVRFYAVNGKIRMMATGKEKIAKYKFMCSPDKVIKENDIFYAISGIQGMTIGQVSFVEEILDFDGATHHGEAECVSL